MYLAIIFLPLLASISSGFFGRKIGVSGAQLLTTLCLILTTVLASLAYLEVGLNSICVSVNISKWIDSESLNVFWGFNFDSLTVSMLIPVLIVSSLVHLYSIGYMGHDPHNQRFFSYLSLFTFMMITLVTSNNYLLMFVGWEGVGVCSYLLVSFWFTRIAANQSSISAFVTNRVGDCFLTIGMFCILWSFGNIDYATVFSLAPYINENIVTTIGICLLIGAMAKSSQLGLHVWLPQAMEGPTPVSALIHAATMVTAGVYLLMRSSPLIEYSYTVLLLSLWIGALTSVFSSLIGLFQQDIKKVIAYSTMSQLGMMVIAIGLSSYNLALFHLINHAFYKALLFLGAGAVIHAVADNQDFRRYGSLKSFLPLTYSVMLIASLSLVAFPFMTGYYSKDFILESAFGDFYFSSYVVYYVATIAAMFTTLYSVKILYVTFLTKPNGPLAFYKMAHEGDIFMSLPLIILGVFSIFFGFIAKDVYIGLGSDFFSDNSIFIHPNNEILISTEFAVPTLYKLLPFVFTILLSTIAILLSESYYNYVVLFKLTSLGYNLFSFFNQRFYVELFYNNYITDLMLKLGGQTTKVLDKGSIELVGPSGLEIGLYKLSEKVSVLDTTALTSQALYILTGLICLSVFPYAYDYSLLIIVISSIVTSYAMPTKQLDNPTWLSYKESSLFFLASIRDVSSYIYKNLYKIYKYKLDSLAKGYLCPPHVWVKVTRYIYPPFCSCDAVKNNNFRFLHRCTVCGAVSCPYCNKGVSGPPINFTPHGYEIIKLQSNIMFMNNKFISIMVLGISIWLISVGFKTVLFSFFTLFELPTCWFAAANGCVVLNAYVLRTFASGGSISVLAGVAYPILGFTMYLYFPEIMKIIIPHIDIFSGIVNIPGHEWATGLFTTVTWTWLSRLEVHLNPFKLWRYFGEHLNPFKLWRYFGELDWNQPARADYAYAGGPAQEAFSKTESAFKTKNVMFADKPEGGMGQAGTSEVKFTEDERGNKVASGFPNALFYRASEFTGKNADSKFSYNSFFPEWQKHVLEYNYLGPYFARPEKCYAGTTIPIIAKLPSATVDLLATPKPPFPGVSQGLRNDLNYVTIPPNPGTSTKEENLTSWTPESSARKSVLDTGFRFRTKAYVTGWSMVDTLLHAHRDWSAVHPSSKYGYWGYSVDQGVKYGIPSGNNEERALAHAYMTSDFVPLYQKARYRAGNFAAVRVDPWLINGLACFVRDLESKNT